MSNDSRITVRLPEDVEQYVKLVSGPKGSATWLRDLLTDMHQGRTTTIEKQVIDELAASHIKRGDELAAKQQENDLLAAKVRDLEDKLAARQRVQAHGSPTKDTEPSETQVVAKISDRAVDPVNSARVAAMIAGTKHGSAKKPYLGRPGVPFTPIGTKSQKKDK